MLKYGRQSLTNYQYQVPNLFTMTTLGAQKCVRCWEVVIVSKWSLKLLLLFIRNWSEKVFKHNTKIIATTTATTQQQQHNSNKNFSNNKNCNDTTAIPITTPPATTTPMIATKSIAITILTCGLEDEPFNGLDAVCNGLDGDGVIPSGLQIGQCKVGVSDSHAAAVPVERLQLVVSYLERINKFAKLFRLIELKDNFNICS